jgi:hypothetical protein
VEPARRGRPPNAASQAELEAACRELKAFKESLRDSVEKIRKLAHVLEMIADDVRVPQHVRTLARVERNRNA